jgi:uroporphyrinogen-III synthase
MTLHGKTFISTVSERKSARIRSAFELLGATILDFPMIEVVPVGCNPVIRQELSQISRYDWIIFTSVSGVEHFFKLWSEMYPGLTLPVSIRIGAVGRQTAGAIESAGCKVTFMGTGNTASDLAEELIAGKHITAMRVLLPLGNLAPDSLRARLAKEAKVTRLEVYQTIKSETNNPETMNRIIAGDYDLVLFTSPSAVDHFAEIIPPVILSRELRIASIGEVTARAALRHGMNSLITARQSTYEGLASEIDHFYNLK